VRQVTRMGNKGATGPFAPLVRVTRNVVGKKDFNKLRGKAISLHSQGGCCSADCSQADCLNQDLSLCC
jgi:hypothetical protein